VLKLLTVDEAKRTLLHRGDPDSSVLETLRAGLRRVFGRELGPSEAVAEILADVRLRGDAALREWTSRIDGFEPEKLIVGPEEIASAVERLRKDLLDSLKFSADRVRSFHERQPLPSWTTNELGGTMGQRMTPLSRVGVYVPGGSAPLPSTLLMCAIPAKVAGVRDVVVSTPPGKDGGAVPDVILAAAQIAGVNAVYRVGGAQAIGALTYGTESIPRVDKIVGPGNLFVTLAKRQAFGLVGLDGLAGPTETVVIADDTANPAWVAADLIAQAEHDVLATAILFTPSRPLAESVRAEIIRQSGLRSRLKVISASLARRGGIVITADLAEAVRLADEFAPEHLCLSVADPARWKPMITRAGGLFIGERSFEVLGDYVAGPSHTMPTGGTARFTSPLNALDFVRITSVIELDDASSDLLCRHAARLAQAEGLDGHAQAALVRIGESDDGNSDVRNETSRAGKSEMRWESLVRPDVAAMERYVPILPFEVLSRRLGLPMDQIVKLDANENPYGPSPKAREALARAPFLNIYPDPENTLLRETLASYSGLPAQKLFAGAGADELIDLVLRATIGRGDAVIDCPPTFGMYSFSADVCAARVVEVPRREDFSLDVDQIEATVRANLNVKIVFSCSPNNPDGCIVPDDGLRRLLALPALIVLDEAYIEFAAPPRTTEDNWLGQAGHIAWAQDYPNLIVLRTFSKLAALAGLRVGYGAIPDWLFPQMRKIKQPYNVNVAASLAAVASLDDKEYMIKNLLALIEERKRLSDALRGFDFLRVYPSGANFVLCRVFNRDAVALKSALERRGVLVRHYDKAGLRDCIRVSVGKSEHTDALINALKDESHA
jgi:histidinol dehydrogenase